MRNSGKLKIVTEFENEKSKIEKKKKTEMTAAEKRCLLFHDICLLDNCN